MGKPLKEKLMDFLKVSDPGNSVPSYYRETELKEAIEEFNEENNTRFDQETQYNEYLSWLFTQNYDI